MMIELHFFNYPTLAKIRSGHIIIIIIIINITIILLILLIPDIPNSFAIYMPVLQ